MKLVEKTCLYCGEAYKIRGPDKHQGSEYCSARTIDQGMRARGFATVERVGAVRFLLEELHCPNQEAMGSTSTDTSGNYYKSAKAVSVLYAPKDFVRAYRLTVGLARDVRLRAMRMLLTDPAELQATLAAKLLASSDHQRHTTNHIIASLKQWEKEQAS